MVSSLSLSLLSERHTMVASSPLGWIEPKTLRLGSKTSPGGSYLLDSDHEDKEEQARNLYRARSANPYVRGYVGDVSTHDALVALAEQIHDGHREIVIFGLFTGLDKQLFEQLTFAATIVRNWRQVTKRNNELVVAIEQDDCTRLKDGDTDGALKDLTCVTHENEQNRHMDPNFRLWAARYRFAARLVQLGYNVLVCDTDVRFFTDPYPFLHGSPLNEMHLLYMRDPRGSASAINGGFTYARGTKAHPLGAVAWILHESWRRPYRHYHAGMPPMGYNSMDQQAMQESIVSAILGFNVFPWSLSTGNSQHLDQSLLAEKVAVDVERTYMRSANRNASSSNMLRKCTKKVLEATGKWWSCGMFLTYAELSAAVHIKAPVKSWKWLPKAFEPFWNASAMYSDEKPFRMRVTVPTSSGPLDPWRSVRANISTQESVGGDSNETLRRTLGGFPEAFRGEPTWLRNLRPDVVEYVAPFPSWFVQGSNCTFVPRCSRRLGTVGDSESSKVARDLRDKQGPPSVAIHTVGHCCRRLLWKAYGWWDSRLEENYLPKSIELIDVHTFPVNLPEVKAGSSVSHRANNPSHSQILRTDETGERLPSLSVRTPYLLAFSDDALAELAMRTRDEVHVQFGALAATAVTSNRLPVYAPMRCSSKAWRTSTYWNITARTTVDMSKSPRWWRTAMREVRDMALAWERPWARSAMECYYLPAFDERMCKSHMPWLSSEPLVRRLRMHPSTFLSLNAQQMFREAWKYIGGIPLIEVTSLFDIGVDDHNPLSLQAHRHALWHSRLCRALLRPVSYVDTKDAPTGAHQIACFDSAPCFDFDHRIDPLIHGSN